MQVHINHQPRELPDGATLADAIASLAVRPPYAAAVNLQFVPRERHAEHRLQAGDRVEVIAPISGG